MKTLLKLIVVLMCTITSRISAQDFFISYYDSADASGLGGGPYVHFVNGGGIVGEARIVLIDPFGVPVDTFLTSGGEFSDTISVPAWQILPFNPDSCYKLRAYYDHIVCCPLDTAINDSATIFVEVPASVGWSWSCYGSIITSDGGNLVLRLNGDTLGEVSSWTFGVDDYGSLEIMPGMLLHYRNDVWRNAFGGDGWAGGWITPRWTSVSTHCEDTAGYVVAQWDEQVANPYTFLWNTGDTTQTVYGLGNGLYTVTITDGNGCTQTVSGTLACDFTTEVSEQVYTDPKLYPSIATSHVYVTLPENSAVSIYDAAGKIVYHDTWREKELSVENWPEGQYFFLSKSLKQSFVVVK